MPRLATKFLSLNRELIIHPLLSKRHIKKFGNIFDVRIYILFSFHQLRIRITLF